MNRSRTIIFGAAIFAAGAATFSPASAQTFQNYRCVDGTKFIVAFFKYDSRAHMQIDGRPVTLARRLAFSGTRYSGGGVDLKITKTATTVRHARRPTTTCEPT
jgi:membrane-bound inhibitor of C-type lysozyme